MPIPCQLAMRGVTTMDKKLLHKYISAFIMGDGGVYLSGKEYRCIVSGTEKEYIDWKASILSNLTNVNVHTVEKSGKKPLTVCTTRQHPVYTKMRAHFYTGNYKGISPHYLKLLDWEMLAILFMDDGSNNMYERDGDLYLSIKLNTKRLSYGDSLLLKKAIKDNLGIEFNVNKQRYRDRIYYYLTLRTKDQAVFLNNIKPYVLNCFAYKLQYPHDWPLSEGGEIVCSSRKRTWRTREKSPSPSNDE